MYILYLLSTSFYLVFSFTLCTAAVPPNSNRGAVCRFLPPPGQYFFLDFTTFATLAFVCRMAQRPVYVPSHVDNAGQNDEIDDDELHDTDDCYTIDHK